MKNATKVLTALLVAASLRSSAGTLYVDASADPATAAGTAEHPFVSIQNAVNAAESGSEIRVAAGVYRTGETTVDGCQTRVAVIGKENLRIVGAGRGKTIVRGAYGTGGDGCGNGAVRCFTLKDSDGTVVSCLTLENGAVTDTGTSSSASTIGGGWYADSSDVYLVDATVSDCRALDSAGMYQGTAVRTLIEGCAVRSASPNGMTGAARKTLLVNSIVTRCSCSPSAGALPGCRLFNVSVADNNSAWTVTGNTESRNSLMINSSGGRETNTVNDVYSECVLQGTAAHGMMQYFAPAVGDFRLLDTSDALNIGDPGWLASLKLPEGVDAFVDFNGAAISRTGTIHAGAIQSVRTPAYGGIFFRRDNASAIPSFTVNGRRFQKDTYAYADVYPVQYVVRPEAAAGYWFNRALRDSDSWSVYGDLDNRLFLMPSPVAGTLETYSFQQAHKVIWVDRENGSDASGTGETNNPYASLQKAVDSVSAASVRALVMVQKGVYDNVAATNDTYGIFRVSTLGKQIHFKSVSGPERTFIVGAPDPDTQEAESYPGCGPRAVHGVLMLSPGNCSVALQGFTLTGCYSGLAVSGNKADSAAYWSQNKSVVSDCIISNNLSANKLATEGLLQRVRATGNRSAKMMFANVHAAACSLFSGNEVDDRSASPVGVMAGPTYNCTLVCALKKDGRLNAGGDCYNSIYDGGNAIYGATTGAGNIYWNVASIGGTSGYVKADPLFVKPEGGRVYACSPAVGGGEAPTASNYGTSYYKYATSDLEGNPLAFGADGKPMVGACHVTAPGCLVTVDEPERGGYALAGGAYGTRLVKEGDSLSFVPAAGSRPCVGIAIGSRDYRFPETGDHRIVVPFDEIVNEGTELSVEGVYTSDWWVDDGGDNANSGFLPFLPKKTLDNVLPLLASGDTLHVLPGTYATGKMIQNAARTVSARAVVGSGVKVVSVGGPDETTIVGEANCRCAYLKSGAELEGFTLTGGRALETTAGNNAEDYIGGGVIGDASDGRAPSYGIVVRNCRVTDCRAAAGSAGGRCQFVRCRIDGNVATGAEPATVYQGSAYGCFIDGNVGTYAFLYCANVINTTVTASNRRADGVTRAVGFTNAASAPADRSRIVNSVFACNVNTKSTESVEIRNNVYPTESQINPKEGMTVSDNVPAAWTTVVFETNGEPVLGTNPAINAADASLATNEYLDAVSDLNGNQRIYDGRMDAGAVEADFRGEYAKCLRVRPLTVVAASPEVFRSDDATVLIPKGTLSMELLRKGKDANTFEFPVVISGDGELTLSVNGTPVRPVETDSGSVYRFTSSAETNQVLFAFSPVAEGDVAELFGARRNIGMILLFR